MNHADICKEISGELEDAARGLSGGILDPEQFRLLVNTLEQQKLKRFGMKLSSTLRGRRGAFLIALCRHGRVVRQHGR